MSVILMLSILMNKIRSSAATISSQTGPRTSTWTCLDLSVTKKKKEIQIRQIMIKILVGSKLLRRRQLITPSTWQMSKIKETVVLAGLFQQHQPLKEASALKTKKLLNVFLNNNWSIARETLKRMRKGLAKIMVCMAAEVAGWDLLGNSWKIKAPW